VVGYVLIKFYTQPDLYNFTKTADIWIDNVQFRQAGGDNLVANGSFEEWVLGVDEMGNNSNSLFIYPNPAGDFIHIELPDDAEIIIISDIMGKEVLRKNVIAQQQFQIDVSQLPKGFYQATSISENGSALTGKLVKQ
jgi:hypothetical protein